jgi:hypothetical protein
MSQSMKLMHKLPAHCLYAADRWAEEAERMRDVMRQDAKAPPRVMALYQFDLDVAVAKEQAYRAAALGGVVTA